MPRAVERLPRAAHLRDERSAKRLDPRRRRRRANAARSSRPGSGGFSRAGGEPPHRAYKVRRIEYFLGKPIHYGIWNPSYQDRFFHRAGVKYVNDIHEYPVFPEAAAGDPRTASSLAGLRAGAISREDEQVHHRSKRATASRKGSGPTGSSLLGAFPAMFLEELFLLRRMQGRDARLRDLAARRRFARRPAHQDVADPARARPGRKAG